jgi:hypothetical protein
MTDLATSGFVESVTDPHRRKDFLDPIEIKTLKRPRSDDKAVGIISCS